VDHVLVNAPYVLAPHRYSSWSDRSLDAWGGRVCASCCSRVTWSRL